MSAAESQAQSETLQCLEQAISEQASELTLHIEATEYWIVKEQQTLERQRQELATLQSVLDWFRQAREEDARGASCT